MKQLVTVLANGLTFEVVQDGDVPNRRYPEVRWFKPGEAVVIGKRHAELLLKQHARGYQKRIDAWADFDPAKLKRWRQYGWVVGIVISATKPE